jgi:hypothetical protein
LAKGQLNESGKKAPTFRLKIDISVNKPKKCSSKRVQSNYEGRKIL